MNRLFISIIFIILLSITITIGMLKPGLNKPVRFSMTDFKIQNTQIADNKTQNIKIETKENTQRRETTIKLNATNSSAANKTIKIDDKTKTKTVDVIIQNQQLKKQDKIIQPQNSQNIKEKEIKITLPNSITNTINPPVKEQPKQIAKQTEEPVIKIEKNEIQNKPLTEQEEIIVWNKWRSNLQNQIMYDTKIAAPIGTKFKFSFTVDRAGRISNLMVWCDTPAYNTIAVNQLKPLILSYQGKSILNFPPRTKRIFTNVTGGFAISTASKYSTPDDYSDIEKVR